MEVINYQSPIGNLKLTTGGGFLKEMHFTEEDSVRKSSDPVLKKAIRQLDEYFEGKRTDFDLPLMPDGTEFQKRVWDRLLKISFGSTLTYLELAKQLGDANVIRAVGRANGQNPIPVIIPCHRVIGSNGKLIGYGGGIERKR